MVPGKEKPEEAIFKAAVQLEDPGARQAYVSQACGGDRRLLADVEALLQYHGSSSFLDAPVFDPEARLDEPVVTEGPGTVIGRYKLLEKIGEGGMAVVYMAEQTEPIRRKVALKIIKLGMDTRQVIARFEAERQALALMDHPSIAKVLDAGATETGRPYFVMELVQGVSVTEYCDKNSLSTRDRLALFLQVCHAVQHAHQKGIIHRDIKPSNVMVTLQDGKPVPKVIDFGIAKATNQRLTEKTLFTRYAHIIGTPAYMSPEQAELSELDIDTRSDIYSLGVLLYELLTGTTPFSEEELRKAGYLEMQRVIREQEPAKPSTRLTTLGETLIEIAKHRGSTPDVLAKAIRGDLDWIVMKALEKDRVRRYDTAQELAADVVRHLSQQPVQAAAPSPSYKMRKFVRRHRIGVLVALLANVAILAVLSALSVATVLIWREQGRTQRALEREQKALAQETQARTESQRQAKIAQAVADFLNNDLLASADPSRARGRQVTVREILEAACQKIEGRFKDEPLIEAAVRQTLGNTYTQLGEYAEAARQLEQARKLYQEHLPDEDSAALESIRSLGWLYTSQGRYREAEPLLIKSLEIARRALGEEHPITLGRMSDLAALYEGLGRYQEAEPLYLKAVEIQKRVLGEDHLSTLNTMNNLAMLYSDQERYQEAEALYRRTVAIKQRQFGEDHPDTLRSMNNLAILFQRQGRYPEAELLNRKILEIRGRVLGEEHPDTLGSMNNLGVVYQNQGRHREAEPLFVKTLEIKERILGEEHPATLNSAHNLAALYKDQGRYGEGEQLYRRVVETRARVLGENHPDTVKARNLLVGLYEAWGKPEEAAKWRDTLPVREPERSDRSSQPATTGPSLARDNPNQPPPGARLPERKRLAAGWKSSWSPDGTRLVFAGPKTGGLQILDLESGQITDLTASGRDPAWSPDGRLIAYVEKPDPNDAQTVEVWLITSTGQSPRKLMDGGYPAWSADGKTLLVQSRKENKIFSVDVGNPDAAPKMFFDGPQSWYPAISPDGKRIAFGGRDALVILDCETKQVVLVWPTPGHRGLLPAWSPDGGRVAFGGFDNEPFGLWVLDVSAQEAIQVAEGPYTMPAWSNDGTKLAFDLRSDSAREIWMVETKAIQGPRVNAAQAAQLSKSLLDPRVSQPRPSAVSPNEDLLAGQPAPGFTLQDLNGQQVSLSDFKGKVVLLDFWATWCPPCVEAIPHLEALHQKYTDAGLAVIGLNDEPNQTKVREFAKGRISYVALVNADRSFREYGIRVIPTLFYIDREGMVRYQESGFSEGKEKEIETRVRELLGSNPRAGADGGRVSRGRQAIGPSPAKGSDIGPTPTARLQWTAAQDATAHRVYYGPDPQNLVLLAEVRADNRIDSPKLEKQRWYCWRVDAVRSDGSVVEGERWSFSTGDLVGWWRFDETEGRAAADSSGHSHDGALLGNPQWQPGRIGGALAFDGRDDYVSVKDTPDFDITREITVACWIQTAGFDIPWQAIIAKGNRAWRMIRAQNGRNIEFACTGVRVPNTTWGNVYGKAVVDDGQWHHLTGVYDGTHVRLYVDGVLDASVEGVGTVNANDDYVLIGANAGDAWRYWRGLIDEVRVYSYALNEEEVKELCAGRGPAPIGKPAWLENK
jgi:serine/threonine protein kinase/tetratricopeptide (TPR) repeat protein/thiol-disulfide isomerase/thioredoxin